MTRILHFTDMHLRHHQPGSARQPERLSREMPSALDRLTEKAKALAPDVVVLTGDVLDVPDDVIEGEPADGRALADWHAEVEADFRMVRDWFDATGIPYVVIPGNHDDEAIFRRVFPESTPIIDKAGIRFFCFWDDLSPERQPRRTGDRRDLFDAALTAAEHARPQVHVQHYTIVPEIESRGWR
ncbi:MAG: metallophosphoesterase, partial [Alphaproteobacteria bacterium]|nr:metallophosphoesterase [Alphaproteobacteria bacterium]